MKFSLAATATSLLLISSSLAQNNDYDYGGDYQDYADYGQEDNLYHDYAQRQQTKE
jgi:hypothetical protein